MTTSKLLIPSNTNPQNPLNIRNVAVIFLPYPVNCEFLNFHDHFYLAKFTVFREDILFCVYKGWAQSAYFCEMLPVPHAIKSCAKVISPYKSHYKIWVPSNLYVPTCIHLFPHARTDTIQVVEHEPNFSQFYPLTISFLVSQFCTLESSLCVSSSDYYLISPFGSSLIKVVLDPKIRTTECTHQTTSVHRMSSWLITM